MNHLTSDTPAADALLSLLLALFLGGVMWLIWMTAGGRFAAEPSLITTPTTTKPIFYEETQP